MKGEDMLPGKTIITTDTSLAEIKKNVRNKTIDEFVERLRPLLNTYHDRVRLNEIAEEMRGME